MTLRFYNTLTRSKEAFKPLKKGHVSIYSCGPTVYDYAHIGNFRAYVAADTIRRYLKYKGFRLKHVMNLNPAFKVHGKIHQGVLRGHRRAEHRARGALPCRDKDHTRDGQAGQRAAEERLCIQRQGCGLFLNIQGPVLWKAGPS